MQPSSRVALRTINCSYVPQQDRVLVTINPGEQDMWACWVTRRLIWALFERGRQLLATTSILAKKAPAGARDELVSFERDAAIASTANAMTPTAAGVLQESARSAELLVRITIKPDKHRFHLELVAESCQGVAGVLARDQLQRVFLMLEMEANRAQWFERRENLPEAGKERARSTQH
ncbi:hypothetical protein [Bradyrhizobium sp. MOS002]|uniref:hypothetical protein n=1 Tax=Bradyrhizobium sp. MOS002 TaxID=2133947 RepID=UPI0011B1E4BC|nr:hypothetical protein [Bradyrhizobium sp. MOS002]